MSMQKSATQFTEQDEWDNEPRRAWIPVVGESFRIESDWAFRIGEKWRNRGFLEARGLLGAAGEGGSKDFLGLLSEGTVVKVTRMDLRKSPNARRGNTIELQVTVPAQVDELVLNQKLTLSVKEFFNCPLRPLSGPETERASTLRKSLLKEKKKRRGVMTARQVRNIVLPKDIADVPWPIAKLWPKMKPIIRDRMIQRMGELSDESGDESFILSLQSLFTSLHDRDWKLEYCGSYGTTYRLLKPKSGTLPHKIFLDHTYNTGWNNDPLKRTSDGLGNFEFVVEGNEGNTKLSSLSIKYVQRSKREINYSHNTQPVGGISSWKEETALK